MRVASAILGGDALPPLMDGVRFTPFNQSLNLLIIVLPCAAAALVLLNGRRVDDIFLWFALALSALVFANLMSEAGGGRYTIGWSVGRVSWIVSALLLFLYFLREFARQQAALQAANQMLEARVVARTHDLEAANRRLLASLEEREVLLREVYHRVKNNIQVVSSLISAEARRLGRRPGADEMRRLQQRIHALGLVHGQLMEAEHLNSFALGPFLKRLGNDLGRMNGGDGADISLAASAPALTAGFAFTNRLGLLVSDLVFGMLDPGARADAAGGKARLEIALGEAAGDIVLRISAPGVSGAPEPSRLTRTLVDQLEGSMTIEEEPFATITVVAPMDAAR